MDLGLMLAAVDGADRIRLARRAEELGFSAVYLGESAGPNAFMDAALLADHTDDIRLALGIVNVYSRTPSLIAMSGAHLDRVSDGRAIVCLGASTRPLVEGVHGVPFEAPIDRLREYVDIIRVGWSGERFDYEGEFYSPQGGRIVIPTVQDRVPLGIAALGRRNRALAGEAADIWLPHLVPRSVFDSVAADVAAAARDAGRSSTAVRTHLWVPTAVDDDPEAARNAIRRHVAAYVGPAASYRNMVARAFPDEAAAIHEAWQAGDRERATGLVTDGMVDDLGIAGPPPAAREQVSDWSEMADMVVFHYPPGSTPDDVEASIDAAEPLL